MGFPFSALKSQIPSGPPFTFIPIAAADMQALTANSTPPTLPIFKGDGFGFSIVPLHPDRPYAASIKLNILGYGKQGNADIQIVPNKWYEGPFSGIEIRPQSGGYTEVGNDFLCNIAIVPYAFERPVDQMTVALLPAAIGGAPTVKYNASTQLLTGVAPTVQADTRAVIIAATGPAQSMFQTTVLSNGAGNVTGGSIDLWQFSYEVGTWFFVGNFLLQIPSSGGAPCVATPCGYLGVRQPLSISPRYDAFLAVPVDVTTDDAAVDVNVTLRLQ